MTDDDLLAAAMFEDRKFLHTLRTATEEAQQRIGESCTAMAQSEAVLQLADQALSGFTRKSAGNSR